MHDDFFKRANLGDAARFDVLADGALFRRIVEDALKHGEALIPRGQWESFLGYSREDLAGSREEGLQRVEEGFARKYPTLRSMLDPWIGCTGLLPLTEAYRDKFFPTLKAMDFLGLLPDEPFAPGAVLNTDMGSLLDGLLIGGFARLDSQKGARILEIGPGYGRLVEVLLGLFPSITRYVLVDAVPATLAYCHDYLQRRLPSRRVTLHLSDEPLPVDADVVITTPWHLASLRESEFDVMVNVESMQEMTQDYVDLYLRFIDERLREGGHFYFSNSMCYVNKGPWTFPSHWRALMWHNTPRSWSLEHPTIVFEKTREDFSRQNQLLRGLHGLQVCDWGLEMKVAEGRNEIAWRDDELKRLWGVERAFNAMQPDASA